jgi:hypothetical protein
VTHKQDRCQQMQTNTGRWHLLNTTACMSVPHDGCRKHQMLTAPPAPKSVR